MDNVPLLPCLVIVAILVVGLLVVVQGARQADLVDSLLDEEDRDDD